MSYIKMLFTILKLPFTILKFSFKTIIVLVFVGSLAANIIMMTWSAGAIAIGGAFTAITGITSVVTGLGNRLDANKKVVSKITKRVAKRTIRGAVRNIAAIPAESIPIAGVTIISGITAWELYDACKTMEDMDEINKSMGSDDTVEKGKVCGMERPSIKEIGKTVKNSPGEAWDAMLEWEINIPFWKDVPDDVREDTDKSWLSAVWEYVFGN